MNRETHTQHKRSLATVNQPEAQHITGIWIMLRLSTLSSLDKTGLVFQAAAPVQSQNVSAVVSLCRPILGTMGRAMGSATMTRLISTWEETTHLIEPYKVGARALMTPCQL